MAGKTYSAGTIFLQVVPVFGDTMRAIQREAKDMNKVLGDEMEKGGRDAGERAAEAIGEGMQKGGKEGAKKYASEFQREFDAAVKGIQKSIAPIELKAQSNDVRRQIRDIREDLESLSGKKIRLEGDAKDAEAMIRVLQAQLAGLREDVKIHAKMDIDQAEKAAAKFLTRLDGLRKAAEIEVRLDPHKAERFLGTFEAKFRKTAQRAAQALGDPIDHRIRNIQAGLLALADVEINADFNDEKAMAEIRKLLVELDKIDGKELTAGANVDTMAAVAELTVLDRAMGKLDGRQVTVNVDVDAAGAVAKMGMLQVLFSSLSRASGGTGNSADEAANSFRSFNIVLLAATILLPALVPILGAVGGGLLALIPILGAVGAGLGSLLIGFSGIGNAVSALGKQADDAGKDTNAAAKTIRGASYAVADAKQGLADAERSAAQASADAARQVADARRAAAQAIEDALERQRDAQEAYRDAVQEVREAEEDLREARKQALQEQDDTADQIRQNKLAERQAVLDLFDATNAYNAALADGSATNYDKEQASINLEQAKERLHEIREEEKALGAEKKKQDKEGVNGSETVKNAQDALTSALEAQREAQEAVGEAAEAVAEARVEGARRVADAVRSQQRAEADGARSVARAQESLRRAQEGYNQALFDTGVQGSASAQAVEDAMNKLGPAGQRFARFIFGLRDNFYRFRDSIQAALLPPVQRALETLINVYGPQFTKFMTKMARSVGWLFGELSESLTGPAWKGLFAIMDELGPKLNRMFGKTTLNWMEVFASVMTAVAPYSERLAKAMLGISNSARRWSASKEGQDTFRRFMEYAAKVGPKVWNFFKNLGLAVLNLMIALAPLGDAILWVLDKFLAFIANMDPKTLGLITTAVMGLVIAFQVAVGAVAIAAGGAVILGSTLALVVFAVVAVIGIIIALSIRFEKFRAVVMTIIKVVVAYYKFQWKILKGIFLAWRDVVVWLWEKVVRPVFTWIAAKAVSTFKKLREAWRNVLKPALDAIWDIVLMLWKNVFKPVFGFIWNVVKETFSFIRQVWKNILFPVFDLLMKVVWKLWTKFVSVVFERIKTGWKVLSTVLSTAYRLTIKPMFDKFMELVGGKKGLQHAFEVAVNAIKKIWGGLKAIMGGPIRFIIDTVINKGLVPGFNKIAKFVGADEMKPLDSPSWTYARGGVFGRRDAYAGGGVMPGYTPGQDVHHFYSPTAGKLHLSGGEAIMRPEFTAAVGSGWVDKMNAIARAEGTSGLRKRLGGGRAFARGGIYWPVPGRDTGTYPDHTGVDINRGSGADDLGDPIVPVSDGTVTYAGWGKGYGHSIWVHHPHLGRTSLYGHASAVYVDAGDPVIGGKTLLGRVGTTGNSTAPHLHFGIYPGGTYDAAMAFLSGAAGANFAGVDASGSAQANPLAKFPGWLKDVGKNPAGYIMDAVRGPMKAFGEKFGDNPYVKMMGALPMKLAKAAVGKVVDILPGPIVSAFNTGKDAAGWVADHSPVGLVGGLLGLGGKGPGPVPEAEYWRGGVLPHNGTMMYDNGGYLPPGITNVVNLTGKPEPVFTERQFANMGRGGNDAAVPPLHYEPHFEGSDLTATDVMDDFEFTVRKMSRRGGKYGEVQS